MDKLLEILLDINSTIDYENEKHLIDGKILNSFSIITLVSQISDVFDVEISAKYLKPENFNSMEAIWNMIQKIQEEE